MARKTIVVRVNPKRRKPEEVKEQTQEKTIEVLRTFSEQLKKIERMQELTQTILQNIATVKGEKQIAPKYPSDMILEQAVEKNGGCKKGKDYSCIYCTTAEKNKCWLLLKKEARLNNLVSQLPMKRQDIAGLQHKELIMLCAHLGLNTFKVSDKSHANLVDTIFQLQYGRKEKLSDSMKAAMKERG